jgi:hypothetical protein
MAIVRPSLGQCGIAKRVKGKKQENGGSQVPRFFFIRKSRIYHESMKSQYLYF